MSSCVQCFGSCCPGVQLDGYRGMPPAVASAAVLFLTAEITGDVGERSVSGAGSIVEPGVVVRRRARRR